MGSWSEVGDRDGRFTRLCCRQASYSRFACFFLTISRRTFCLKLEAKREESNQAHFVGDQSQPPNTISYASSPCSRDIYIYTEIEENYGQRPFSVYNYFLTKILTTVYDVFDVVGP